MEEAVSIELRNYREGESEIAADIRGLKSEEERSHFKKIIDSGTDWTGHYLHLALVLDDKLIGDIQFRRCHETMPQGVAHVGMEISESYRGQGAGTKALELIWNWALSNNLHRLEASTDTSNFGAQKALEKAGWIYEGTLRKLFIADGISHDYMSYAKTI
jgi:RimJ/RimL family protein N-acetyltransferase